MSFLGLTPAEYVRYLTSPGLPTAVGSVPITSYVSTGGRSPQAYAVFDFFNRLLREPATSNTDGLRNLYDQIINSGGSPRTSNWRRVFTGQGTADNLLAVLNYVANNQEMLATATPRGGDLSPFRRFFPSRASDHQGQSGLRAMVENEIWGLDCLGFVGSYLVWCGLLPRYPEYNQQQYLSNLSFDQVSHVVEIETRCVVIWPSTSTEHIAIIDEVTEREGNTAIVNLCQSSRGGPQTNIGVRLTVNSARAPGPRRFSIRGGTPEIPVAGTNVILGRRDRW